MTGLFSVITVIACQTAGAAERPDFLLMLADDCTHTDLPVYGVENARTPAIDRLASQGMTFTRAYLRTPTKHIRPHAGGEICTIPGDDAGRRHGRGNLWMYLPELL